VRNHAAMEMPNSGTPDLDRQLLLKGVGRLIAVRERCADCGRTPLAGERVHLYERDGAVCALCRPQRSADPERTQLVRGGEHGHTVRVTARPAA
jgi:hypothetical protein